MANLKLPDLSEFLTVLSILLIAIGPLLAALIYLSSGHEETAPGIFSLVWPIVFVLLFIFARQACASEKLAFGQGLLWVTYSLRSHGVIFVLILVFPSLLFVFFCSVILAALGTFTNHDYPPFYYGKLIGVFYRRRKQ